MVLTPIAKHTSSLAPSFYALSLQLPPAQRLETDESALARYEDCLQAPKNRHNYRPNRPDIRHCPQRQLLALYLLDDPLFVGSFEFSSQPLFEEELVAHYTRI